MLLTKLLIVFYFIGVIHKLQSFSFHHLVTNYLKSKNQMNHISRNMVPDEKIIFQPDSSKLSTANLKKDNQLFVKAVDYNWHFGVCSHYKIYENNDNRNVQFFRYFNDQLAFGLSNGYCYIMNMTSAELLYKFYQHTGPVNAIDYDGKSFISGGIDGILNIYDIDAPPSEYLGKCIRRFQSHSKPITAVKLAYRNNAQNLADPIIVTCGEDNLLLAINSTNGSLLLSYTLSAVPLCLGCQGDWVAVGLADGRVQLFSLRSGRPLMEFQAHNSEVRCLHFLSTVALFTGGEDGTVRRWDFSGRMSRVSPTGAGVGVLDLMFKEAIESVDSNPWTPNPPSQGLPSGCVQMISTPDLWPVTTIQADDRKVVTGHQNGAVRVFDSRTGAALFHIEGRPGSLRSLQFDDTRLLCDGSLNVLVLHDFSVSYANLPDENMVIELIKKS